LPCSTLGASPLRPLPGCEILLHIQERDLARTPIGINAKIRPILIIPSLHEFILLSLLHLLLLLPHLSQTLEIFENNILIKGIFGESNNPLGVRTVSCF
jgi:hypothetical protein